MIEIKNVSYSYENAVTDGALKNVSLCSRRGRRYCCARIPRGNDNLRAGWSTV